MNERKLNEETGTYGLVMNDIDNRNFVMHLFVTAAIEYAYPTGLIPDTLLLERLQFLIDLVLSSCVSFLQFIEMYHCSKQISLSYQSYSTHESANSKLPHLGWSSLADASQLDALYSSSCEPQPGSETISSPQWQNDVKCVSVYQLVCDDTRPWSC